MDEEWIAFLRRRQEHHRSSIGLMKAGVIAISQRVDGQLTDTTEQAIADQERWLAEIDDLLSRASPG